MRQHGVKDHRDVLVLNDDWFMSLIDSLGLMFWVGSSIKETKPTPSQVSH